MKVLATLALITAGLTLSSCVCKDGKCMFSKNKKTSACCTAGSTAKKGTAAACCSH